MTPVQSPEAGPADLAGPVGAEPVSTADDAASAQQGPPDGRRTRSSGGGRRVVLAAAIAGALLAGGLAWTLESGDSAGLKTIEITARYSRFEPDRVTVKPGSTVRFVIQNVDPIDHEFIIGPPETHDRHERGEPRFHSTVPGEVTVPAGATVETTWTFGPSGSPGVAYGCHLAGHWNYGMRGEAMIR